MTGLSLLAILVMWFRVVHQHDEILALVRNEVVAADAGGRWAGSFVNTNARTLRDVAVTVSLLDASNHPLASVQALAAELPFGARLNLQAPLPTDAVLMRIESVQWRMDRSTADKWLLRAPDSARMGPFRDAWEFGYVMADPAAFSPGAY